jgi:hypothetical protein
MCKSTVDTSILKCKCNEGVNPAAFAGYGGSLGWRDELPDEQGYWWWWDCDGLPVPVSIMFSGTDNTYFATAGQLGWNRAQMVKDMGGMWMRLPEPMTPETKEIYCHACSDAGGASMPVYHLPPACPVKGSP